MVRTLYVDCPCCKAVLEVSAESGKVVQSWAHDEQQKGGDRLKNALNKMKSDKEKRGDLFQRAKSEMDQSREKADDLFKQEIKKAKEKGVKENPFKPFDLD